MSTNTMTRPVFGWSRDRNRGHFACGNLETGNLWTLRGADGQWDATVRVAETQQEMTVALSEPIEKWPLSEEIRMMAELLYKDLNTDIGEFLESVGYVKKGFTYRKTMPGLGMILFRPALLSEALAEEKHWDAVFRPSSSQDLDEDEDEDGDKPPSELLNEIRKDLDLSPDASIAELLHRSLTKPLEALEELQRKLHRSHAERIRKYEEIVWLATLCLDQGGSASWGWTPAHALSSYNSRDPRLAALLESQEVLKQHGLAAAPAIRRLLLGDEGFCAFMEKAGFPLTGVSEKGNDETGEANP